MLRFAARFVFGKLLPRWPYPVLRGPLRGYWFILGAAAGEAGGVSVHLGQVEVAQTACLLELLKPGQVFFDVGANVGYYSLLASKCVGPQGTVAAFEPVPRNVSFLWRHLELNRARNVNVLMFACADSSAVEVFQTGDSHSEGHLAQPGQSFSDIGQAGKLVMVATLPLDIAAERLNLRPDVIKIDVEGAELRVLRGAHGLLTSCRPRLLLSVHSPQLRADCLDHLQRLQYRVLPLDEPIVAEAMEFMAEPIS